MDRYAVIGNPIGHSKSPLIHAAFARQTGEQLEYLALLGRRDAFAEDVRAFLADGGRGLNVTVPFKQEAWQLADSCAPRASMAQAVNTLVLQPDGSLLGDNTDGVGLVRDLEQNHACSLQGLRVLLLGAGGASRGVLQPLLAAAPAALHIANRTAARAQALAAAAADLGPVSGGGLDALEGQQFDLIINGTAAGLDGEVPQLPAGVLRAGGLTYDMMYGDEPTAFVRWGLGQGAASAMDGLGMLVEQAAESFFLWRGTRPDTAGVIRDLRQGCL